MALAALRRQKKKSAATARQLAPARFSARNAQRAQNGDLAAMLA